MLVWFSDHKLRCWAVSASLSQLRVYGWYVIQRLQLQYSRARTFWIQVCCYLVGSDLWNTRKTAPDTYLKFLERTDSDALINVRSMDIVIARCDVHRPIVGSETT
jgi:hypothetical protein